MCGADRTPLSCFQDQMSLKLLQCGGSLAPHQLPAPGQAGLQKAKADLQWLSLSAGSCSRFEGRSAAARSCWQWASPVFDMYSGSSQRGSLLSEFTYQASACKTCMLCSPEKGLSRLLRRSGLSDSPSSEVAVDSGDEASSSSKVSRLSAGGALRCRAICRAGRKAKQGNKRLQQGMTRLPAARTLRCP